MKLDKVIKVRLANGADANATNATGSVMPSPV